MTQPRTIDVRAALRHAGALALFVAVGMIVSRGARRGWDAVLDPGSLASALFATVVVAGIAFVVSILVRALLVHRPVKRPPPGHS